MYSGVDVTCCSCGCVFTINETLHGSLRKTGKTFYCPSGHAQSYTPGPTEADKLRGELERAQRSIAFWKADAEEKRSWFRCIVAGCDEHRKTKAAMRTHLDREHQIREDVKCLAADAGRDARNSDVGAP